MKKVLLIFVSIFGGLWILGIVLVNVFDLDWDKYFSPSYWFSRALVQTTAMMNPDWTTYKNDDFHFSVDTPCTMKEIKMPDNMKLKNVRLQGMNPLKKVTLNLSAMDMGDPNLDLDKTMDQEVKAFKSMDKIMTNLQISTSPVTFADTPGLMAAGTYQMMGKEDWEIKILKIKKGTVQLDFVVQYGATNDGKAAADRIFNSLKFTN